jgi:hypothetical protein
MGQFEIFEWVEVQWAGEEGSKVGSWWNPVVPCGAWAWGWRAVLLALLVVLVALQGTTANVADL